MILMSGIKLAEKIKKDIKKEIDINRLKISVAVILIGNDEASEKYIAIKKREAEKIGINFSLFRIRETNNQTRVINLINKLNLDKNVTGIVVQLPLPKGFIPNEILEAIDPKKDVDGLNSANLGRLIKGIDGIFPATPVGTIRLLKNFKIPLVSRKIVVIGQSNLVGKPLAQMLLNEKATVTVANKDTINLMKITRESDIVISAVGKPKLITAEMINSGVVVIDIGTTVRNGKIYGDVDFDKVSRKASYITPNPGGIGPMTVAILLSNLLKAYDIQRRSNG